MLEDVESESIGQVEPSRVGRLSVQELLFTQVHEDVELHLQQVPDTCSC